MYPYSRSSDTPAAMSRSQPKQPCCSIETIFLSPLCRLCSFPLFFPSYPSYSFLIPCRPASARISLLTHMTAYGRVSNETVPSSGNRNTRRYLLNPLYRPLPFRQVSRFANVYTFYSRNTKTANNCIKTPKNILYTHGYNIINHHTCISSACMYASYTCTVLFTECLCLKRHNMQI